MLFLTVFIPIKLPPSVKYGIFVMYDTVMIGADDNLVAGIVVKALYEIIDMMRFRYMGTEFFAD